MPATSDTSTITMISNDVGQFTGQFVDDSSRGNASVLVDRSQLPSAIGWELTDGGLCRGDVCRPLSAADRVAVTARDGRMDLAQVARLLDQRMVSDPEAAMVALSLPSADRHRALRDLQAPDFSLPDLDEHQHALSEWRGEKKLLVTFSSWCGCRYDLPGWQRLHEELAPEGFTTIAVAIDDSADVVQPWVEGISMPVLYDRHHLLTELFAISNVPTVLWIDENDHIARPNGYAFGTDLFSDFTGTESEPHLDAVRRWVHTGEIPTGPVEPSQAVADLSNDEIDARLHFRMATEARRRGLDQIAHRHFDVASKLAPDDFTVWRAAMPLTGHDPFGDEFLSRYQGWKEAGAGFHGLPPIRGPKAPTVATD